jgi:tetratricopeptide (TPR) repeat protein
MAEPSFRERAIRVFVSSTFRDMAAERDVLVNYAFPKLRALCTERGVAFTEIDLRWGLTDEEVAEGRVLPICLQEIRRCRPYFIGLLGERYGWVPPEIPEEMRQGQDWLIPHAGSTSVTELEILHGVLNDPEMDHNAFFYLRDPAYIGSARFLADTADDPVGRELFSESSPEAREKLAHLKATLRAGRHPVSDYSDPQRLGELVLADLTTMLEEKFPVETVLDPLDAESRRHEFFAESRSRVYVRRASYFDALDDFAETEEGAAMTVLGESGSGKSSLLATWAIGYRSRHPEELVLMHFVGSSRGSAEVGPLLNRLNSELGRHLGIESEGREAAAVPTLGGGAAEAGEPPDPTLIFKERLLAAGADGGGVVLILDALDQISGGDDAKSLKWLPTELPAGVRIVLSTVAGAAREELKRRGWLEGALRVRPLERAERGELIRLYLGHERAKNLNHTQLQEIVDLPQAESPLYLRILLDELRIWDRHETLDSRIEKLTSAKTVSELLGLVLARYERAFESGEASQLPRPGLVGDAMRLLWASHHGLEESELLDLLGDQGERLPPAIWAPLRIAAAEMLIDRDGLIGLAHLYFRKAVKERYLGDARSERDARRAIAAYFNIPPGQSPSPRALEERPAQLSELEDWEGLAALLATPEWLLALRDRDEFEAPRLWARIQSRSAVRAGDVYEALDEAMLERAGPRFRLVAGSLLNDLDSRGKALHMIDGLRGDESIRADPRKLMHVVLRIAGLRLHSGQTDQARDLYIEAEQIARRLGDAFGLALSLSRQAEIHQDRGEIDLVPPLLDEGEQIAKQAASVAKPVEAAVGIWRDLEAPEGFAEVISRQATIRRDRGEFALALELLADAERMSIRIGNRRGQAYVLAFQSILRIDRGEAETVLTVAAKAEEIWRELGTIEGLSILAPFRAWAHLQLGESQVAEEVLIEGEKSANEIGSIDSLGWAALVHALVAAEVGKAEESSDWLERAERLFRGGGADGSLVVVLMWRARHCLDHGEAERALAIAREAEEIERRIGNLAGLADSLALQGGTHRVLGAPETALAFFRDAERIRRDLGGRAEIAEMLMRQGELHHANGEADRALDKFREAEAVLEGLDPPSALAAVAQTWQGRILGEREEPDLALERWESAGSLYRELGDESGLATTLVAQALHCLNTEPERAEALCQEAVAIQRRLGDGADLAETLERQGEVHERLGDLEQASADYREVAKIFDELGRKGDVARMLKSEAQLYRVGDESERALELYSEAEAICRDLEMAAELADVVWWEADIHRDRDETDRALERYEEAGRILGELQSQAESASVLAARARTHLARGESDRALALFGEAEAIYRQLDRGVDVAGTLKSRAEIHRTREELDLALALFREAETIYRDLDISAELAAMIYWQGIIYGDRTEFDEALRRFEEAEAISRENGPPVDVAESLKAQAEIHRTRGELDRALALYREVEPIYRDLDLAADRADSIWWQGDLCRDRDEPDRALSLYREVAAIFRGLDDRLSLANVLVSQAGVHQGRGEDVDALSLYREAEGIFGEIEAQADLARVFGLQAEVHQSNGETEPALSLYRKAEKIYRELDSRADLASVLAVQATTYETRGELDPALSFYRKAEALYRELGSRNDVARLVELQGQVHRAGGEPGMALPFYREAEAIYRDLGIPSGLAGAIWWQADIHRDRGEPGPAQEKYGEAAEIFRESGNREDRAIVLSERANIILASGEFDLGLRIRAEAEGLEAPVNEPPP